MEMELLTVMRHIHRTANRCSQYSVIIVYYYYYYYHYYYYHHHHHYYYTICYIGQSVSTFGRGEYEAAG